MSPVDAPSQQSGRMVRNVLHLGMGQVATTVLSVLLSATIARRLGASDFGLYYLLTSIATFGYVLVDWGHGPYVTREIARSPERSGDLMGSVLVVRAVMALVVCGLATLTTWFLGYDLRTRSLAALVILTWLPVYLGLTYSWVFRGVERMDCDALINVVLKFTTLAASAVCLAIGGRLVSLVLAYAFAGAITFALAAWLYRRLGLPDLHVSGVTARELIYQGVPLLAISVTVTVQPYIDANILYKLVPTGVLGWYGAAWNIAGTLVAPATILAASMYPRLSKASHEAGEFKRALRGAFRPLLVVAVLGAVGTYLFADVAVGIVYSRQKFGPAGGILRAFAPALMLLYIDMLLGTAIMARGGAGRLAGAKVLAVAVTTGLELILVPWCQARFGDGGMGVMFAMTAGELVMVAAAVILIRDAVGGDMIVDALRAAGAGAVTVLLMRLLPPVSPFVAIPVCVLTFLGVASATKLLNRSDVDLLMTAFRSRRAAAISAVDPLSSRAR